MRFWEMRNWLPGGTPRAAAPRYGWYFRPLASLQATMALVLLALALAFPVLALPQAANPNATVPKTKYRPIIQGYTPYRPVEPGPWRDMNQQVAPKPKAKTEEEKR